MASRAIKSAAGVAPLCTTFPLPPSPLIIVSKRRPQLPPPLLSLSLSLASPPLLLIALPWEYFTNGFNRKKSRERKRGLFSTFHCIKASKLSLWLVNFYATDIRNEAVWAHAAPTSSSGLCSMLRFPQTTSEQIAGKYLPPSLEKGPPSLLSESRGAAEITPGEWE